MHSNRKQRSEDEPKEGLKEHNGRAEDTDFGMTDLFGGWNPAVDIIEDKDSLTIKVELPGFNREDINVSVHQNNLVLSGVRNYEDEKIEGEFYRSERFYGKFNRSVPLPAPVGGGKIKARYKNGVLTVTLPRTHDAEPKDIQITIR